MRPLPAGSAEPTPPAGNRPAERPARGGETSGRRPRVPARARLAASVLLLGYLGLVTWLALRPLSMLWVSPANLEPLSTIRSDLARGPEEAGRTLAAGLLRLAPLGVLLPLVGAQLGGGRLMSLARTVFVGTMVSLALECGQTLTPSRVSDIDSVLLNTVGVALTHQLCYGPLRRFAPLAAPPFEPPSEPPAAGRAPTTPPVPRAACRPRTHAGHRTTPGTRPAGPPVPRPQHPPQHQPPHPPQHQPQHLPGERRPAAAHEPAVNTPLEATG
ncbi:MULTISPECIES: VanZ family protein [Streptomyces]|uniref:VanZ family protein n=1 Tax=Streptomyces TaxID=1883 RepID=UPI001D04277E|nr:MULTISPECIES: VanZ family protein [Streptomyces]